MSVRTWQQTLKRPLAVVAAVLILGGSWSGAFGATARAAADTVDELHYSFGETPDSVVFDWHGAEQNIYYGLDASYGSQAVAGDSTITPVDSAGPFREVKLSGLSPNTTYHYMVGTSGVDHTFKTMPTGDFRWVDMGDTGATNCDPWIAQTHALVASQTPDFVTHGGDIAYANECGVAAVHQYYVDQQAWSTGAAFQPAWGNHEYGAVDVDAPAGTPAKDSMSNYKGRSYITNGQLVPKDTTAQTNAPGCGWETGASVNFCQGEDWGWFTTGHVLFISIPEPWTNAYADWTTKASTIMASAQADPNVDFIITYGHRPAYSSLSSAINNDLRTALTTLSQSYSPTASHPTGKYALNIAHHVHGGEVFSPIGGLVNITDGGGGAGQTSYDTTPMTGSIYRTVHPEVLSAVYNATQHTLSLSLLCGPDYAPNPKSPCTYGSTLYSQTFQSANTPAVAKLATSLSDGVSNPQAGQQVTYTVSVADQTSATTAQGATATVNLPAGETLVSASAGGVVNGNSASWSLGTLTGGQAATTAQVVAQVAPGNPGDYLTASAQVTTSDGACQNAGSVCSANDTDTIAAPAPTTKQWIGNLSVDLDLTGWTGVYGNTALSSITRDTTTAHSGAGSIKVTALAGASNASLGFNDNPRWVLSTTAGTVYTQSAWVKPTFVGQKINLRLKEWKGATLVTDNFVTLTATAATVNTWQPITQTLTAGGTGNQLSFAVYASAFNAGQSFYVDDFSLTTPQ